jgi:hypothetical protein
MVVCALEQGSLITCNADTMSEMYDDCKIKWHRLENPQWRCPELTATEWKNNPEFCPTLSQVVEPEVILPGVASRAAVQEAIERVRIAKDGFPN